MVGVHFAEEERRVDIRQVHLPGAVEVALGAVEILSHHAEVDVFGAEDMANLTQHFLDADVAAGVAGAVVSGEEQF